MYDLGIWRCVFWGNWKMLLQGRNLRDSAAPAVGGGPTRMFSPPISNDQESYFGFVGAGETFCWAAKEFDSFPSDAVALKAFVPVK
jgi:hypothetical protein